MIKTTATKMQTRLFDMEPEYHLRCTPHIPGGDVWVLLLVVVESDSSRASSSAPGHPPFLARLCVMAALSRL